MSTGETGRKTCQYGMLGYDGADNSFVWEEVTSTEAIDKANEFNLSGYILAPTRGPDYKRGRGAKTLFRVRKNGELIPAEFKEWLKETFHYMAICDHEPAAMKRPKKGVVWVKIDYGMGEVRSTERTRWAPRRRELRQGVIHRYTMA